MSVLSECRFYGIIDLGYVQESDITRVAEQMIEGCVDMIQLRGKGKSLDELTGYAARLHELTARFSTPLIVNDHAEIASRIPVEGVHVGQDDDSIEVARRKAGRDVLIGKSTHSLEQAQAAQREGADYIGFGPIFATPTKPDYPPIGVSDIKQVHAEVDLPIFCIGGIKIDNLEQVFAAGARRVGIVGDDLPESEFEFWKSRKIDSEGVQRVKGKTFRWSGEYSWDLNTRETRSITLNVFEHFKPVLPESYRQSDFVLLANIAPSLQAHVLDQMERPRVVVADTMDLWIATTRPDLDALLRRVDLLILNDSEAREMTKDR